LKGNTIPRAWARINLQALKSNIQRVRSCSPASKIVAVIKANAYGHGMEAVVRAMNSRDVAVDCLAVASIDEICALLEPGSDKPLLLLSGFRDADELRFLVQARVEFVVHADYQLRLLKDFLTAEPKASGLGIWLKMDSGMHRLGLQGEEVLAAYNALHSHTGIVRLVLLSHFARADETTNQQAIASTNLQIEKFSSMYQKLGRINTRPLQASLAASAAIVSLPHTHYDYVRPGIMLYGCSPLAETSAASLGLKPVMTLCARIVAVKKISAGESIGYGATFTCTRDTRIALVSIGYADGYPRSAPNGTPVILHLNTGMQKSQLLGRVSMDMLTIDVTDHPDAAVGNEVVLWGEGLPIEEIASLAGTISYELTCKVTRRVPFMYLE
jgi:alanine racemase